MYDYPPFDGTQACQDPPQDAARAFTGAVGADPAPALALCARCPLLDECRDWVLAHDTYGVWGGTTEDDRDTIRSTSHPALGADDTDHVLGQAS